MAAAADVGDAEVVNMRTTMNYLTDSVTTLHSQMAALMEDPTTFMNRARGTTDAGPAVRARAYDHEIAKGRGRMIEIGGSQTHREPPR